MVREGSGHGRHVNPNYAMWLLEAIRKIKRQKQRPSVERICNAVRQHHEVSANSITEQLELAVQDGSVLKVYNKGLCSYKDPARVAQLQSRTLHVNKKTDLTKNIVRTIKELGEIGGSNLRAIEKYMRTGYTLQFSDGVDFTRQVRISVKKAVSAGMIEQDGRNYKVCFSESDSVDTASADASQFGDEQEELQDMALVNKNKKPATPLPFCSFSICTKRNRDGMSEELISCADCGNSGHPSCLKFSPALTERVRNMRWQCIECKTCSLCGESGKEDNMLFCDACDRGFHMECCKPPLKKPPEGSWICPLCNHAKRMKKSGRKSLKYATTSVKKKHAINGASTGKIKKHKYRPEKCPTPGCNGSGNVNGKSSHHRKQYACPKLPPEQRPPKPKKRISHLSSPDDSSGDSGDDSTEMSPPVVRQPPHNVSESDLELFKKAREKAQMAMNIENHQAQGSQNHEEIQKPPENGKGKVNGDDTEEEDDEEVDEDDEDDEDDDSRSQTNSAVPSQDGDRTTNPTSSPGHQQGRFPPCIEFGKYEIQTWYSSPYPQEYARLPKLYICEFCLKYMKTRSILQRHLEKCALFHPPANEIYRCGEVSVFEVDGNVNKIYCQNLCLLAKLFLDHKTLYYDVEPFLFYVLTFNDEAGCHLVGYFSKEKHCQQKYNVSCIMTMPQYQRKGYGRLLIDFSYLLSRIEGQPGSPEKPLSDLGKVSYQSYWKSIVLEYLHTYKDQKITIMGMSRTTGMCPHDIAATLEYLHLVGIKEGKCLLVRNQKIIDDHMARLKGRRVELDDSCLQWTPLINSQTLLDEEMRAKMELQEMSDIVEDIAEARRHIQAMSPHKSVSASLSTTFPSPKDDITSTPSQDTEEKLTRRRDRKRRESFNHAQALAASKKLKVEKRDQVKKEKTRSKHDKKSSSVQKSSTSRSRRKRKRKSSKQESRNSCKDKSPSSKNDLPMTPRKKCGWPPKGVKKGTSAKRSLSRRGRPPQEDSHDPSAEDGGRQTEEPDKPEPEKSTRSGSVRKSSGTSVRKSSRTEASKKVDYSMKESSGTTDNANSNVTNTNLEEETYTNCETNGGEDSKSLHEDKDTSVPDGQTEEERPEDADADVDDSSSSSSDSSDDDSDSEHEEESVSVPEAMQVVQEPQDAVDTTQTPPVLTKETEQNGGAAESDNESDEQPMDEEPEISDKPDKVDSPKVPTEPEDNSDDDEEEDSSSSSSDSEPPSPEPAPSPAVEVPKPETIKKVEEENIPPIEQDTNKEDVEEEEEEEEEEEHLIEEGNSQSEICPVVEMEEDSETNKVEMMVAESEKAEEDSGAEEIGEETLVDTNQNEEEEENSFSGVINNETSVQDRLETTAATQHLEQAFAQELQENFEQMDSSGSDDLAQSSDNAEEDSLAIMTTLDQPSPAVSHTASSSDQTCESPSAPVSAPTSVFTNPNTDTVSDSLPNQEEEEAAAAVVTIPDAAQSEPSTPAIPTPQVAASSNAPPAGANAQGQVPPSSTQTVSNAPPVPNSQQTIPGAQNITSTPSLGGPSGGFSGVEMDVPQLALESPTSVSSSEMTNNSVETTPSQTFSDCAQVQNNFCGNSMNSSPGNFMEPVNTQMTSPVNTQMTSPTNNSNFSIPNPSPSSSTNYNMPNPSPNSNTNFNMPNPSPSNSAGNFNMPNPSPSNQNPNFGMPNPSPTANTNNNFNLPNPSPNNTYTSMPTPSPTNSNHSFTMATPSPTANPAQNYNMPNTVPTNNQNFANVMCSNPPPSNYTSLTQVTQRLSHNVQPSSCAVGGGQRQQNANYQNNTSCSLAKLQQLTNGIMDIAPDSTMTPPPNLTPPPINMTPPPSMNRNVTPPIPNLQPQVSVPAGYKSYHASRRMAQKPPNVTVNPNMTFTPNVTIQPGTNMITGYNMLNMNGYRMQQPTMLNTNMGYITNPAGFINQAQLPMQMGMVNMHPQANFQQQMQPGQANNAVYTTYGYINSGLAPQAFNMNGHSVMRR